MTPELWTTIIIAVLALGGTIYNSWRISSRPPSQVKVDTADTVSTISETLDRVINQNDRLMEQNQEILARLSGEGELTVRFPMKVLLETGEAPVREGRIRIMKEVPEIPA